MHTTLFARKFFLSSIILSLLFLNGCSQTQIASGTMMPSIDNSQKVALYALENYTDTPKAGMRAANIAEGVLLAKGYQIDNRINNATRVMTLDQKISDARRHNDRYLFVGGVSEWRYKTGIDGEPAISLQFKLIDTASHRVIWSATGANSSWGNASIGTVAQELITTMLKKSK